MNMIRKPRKPLLYFYAIVMAGLLIFNMFVMPRALMNDYCAWLFDILFTLESRVSYGPQDPNNLAKTAEAEASIDISSYSDFHKRFYGRISELLLDVYLETNNITDYKELKVIDMDGVNWFKKGSAFLSAKFTGKKYEKSF